MNRFEVKGLVWIGFMMGLNYVACQVLIPRSFSDIEKERIRADLVKAAGQTMVQYGVRKTSVDQLVASAGISKGAFYLFFNTKEELLFEAVLEMQKEIRQALLQ